MNKNNKIQNINRWNINIQGGLEQFEYLDHHQNLCTFLTLNNDLKEIIISVDGQISTIESNGILGNDKPKTKPWMYKMYTPITKPGNYIKSFCKKWLDLSSSELDICHFVANDIKGNNKSDIYSKNLPDRTPQEVKRLFKVVIHQIRDIHKEIPIFAIETTPTISRWKAWDKISLANDLIKKYCDSNDRLFYISTRDYFIGDNGLPTEDFFIRDKLHLNRKGYALWANIIKKNLSKMTLLILLFLIVD